MLITNKQYISEDLAAVSINSPVDRRDERIKRIQRGIVFSAIQSNHFVRTGRVTALLSLVSLTAGADGRLKSLIGK